MQITAVSPHVFPNIGHILSASQNGRMSLPVSSPAYFYSHFRHVYGVPAPDGVQGVDINRLRILDTLIGRLSQLDRSPEIFSIEEMDGDSIVSLISQYHEQVRAIQNAQADSPYASAPYFTGVLFNIFV